MTASPTDAVDDRIRVLLDRAPPLTPERVTRLAALLAPPSSTGSSTAA